MAGSQCKCNPDALPSLDQAAVNRRKSYNFCEQVKANETIPLQVCTQSGRGNHRRTLEESCCQCRTRQNTVSAPPRSNSRAQMHEKIVGSGSS